jgi:hypothetical protein
MSTARRAILLALAGALVSGLPRSRPCRASSIADDESVVVYRTTAWRDGDAWVVPIHGWIGELEPDSIWRHAVGRSLLAVLGRAPSPAERSTFADRMAWFLGDSERWKALDVTVGGVRVRLPRTGADGHFRGEVRLPLAAVAGDVAIATVARDGRRFVGASATLDGGGLAVISDIDDTVRVSEVGDRRRLLENTFLRPFVAVPGVAAIYRRWAAEGAAFFYVSGSPWQLYVPRRDFLATAGFPSGELVLRQARFTDDLFASLRTPPDAHKLAAIRAILARFPARRFVLVGDDGEHDPAIYRQIAREHPGRIAEIRIRRVPGGHDAGDARPL